MADKFTRTGLNEGDIYFATTANSAKSRESLEDNIDDALLKTITSDFTEATTTSTTETTLASLTVPANSVRNHIIVQASGTATSNTKSGVIRLKIGALGSEVTVASFTASESIGANVLFPVVLIYRDSSQTWTNSISVIITGQSSGAGGSVTYKGCIILGT